MTEVPFRCVACGGSMSVRRFKDCRDLYLGHPSVVNFDRCCACGLVQQTPVPDGLGSLYSDYPVHSNKSRLHEWFRRVVLRDVYFDPSTMPPGSRLLDFGCGDGWFLDSMKKTAVVCEGYEFQPDHARRLAAQLNLKVFGATDELVNERRRAYQAITMHNVLEHVADPRATVALLGQLLAPGGLLYIVLPNVESWEGRLFARRWHGLDPPRHVSFPTPSVMRSLATHAGLEFESTKSVAFPNTSAASFVSVVAGRYRHALFLLALPVAIVLSRLAPSGSSSFVLRKRLSAQ